MLGSSNIFELLTSLHDQNHHPVRMWENHGIMREPNGRRNAESTGAPGHCAEVELRKTQCIAV